MEVSDAANKSAAKAKNQAAADQAAAALYDAEDKTMRWCEAGQTSKSKIYPL